MEANEKLEKVNETLSRILDTKIELKKLDELYERFIYKINKEALQQIIIPIMEIFLDDKENCKKLWRSLDSNIQVAVGEEVIELIGNNKEMFGTIWDHTRVDAQEQLKAKILEKYSDNNEFLLEFFLGASEKIQEENKEMLPQIREYIESAPNSQREMLYLWTKMSENLQLENPRNV
jgi:hypothetical protein